MKEKTFVTESGTLGKHYKDFWGRPVVEIERYKIVFGRTWRDPIIGKGWLGYYKIDGKYVFVCAYFFCQFKNYAEFLDQLKWETKGIDKYRPNLSDFTGL